MVEYSHNDLVYLAAELSHWEEKPLWHSKKKILHTNSHLLIGVCYVLCNGY